MLVQLKNIFTLNVLPEVLTRSMMPNYNNSNRKYCVCGRPSFEPMVARDSSKCQFEWFHFWHKYLKHQRENGFVLIAEGRLISNLLM